MKKCKITVQKIYSRGKKGMKTTHSIEVFEDGLATLCIRLNSCLCANEDGDLRHLFNLLRSY